MVGLSGRPTLRLGCVLWGLLWLSEARLNDRGTGPSRALKDEDTELSEDDLFSSLGSSSMKELGDGLTGSRLLPTELVTFQQVDTNDLEVADGSVTRTQPAGNALQGNALTGPHITDVGDVRGVCFTVSATGSSASAYVTFAGLTTAGSFSGELAGLAFAAGFRGDGGFFVWEKGVSLGQFGTFTLSSSNIEVSINSQGTVEYWVDEDLRYTSGQTPQYPLVFVVAHLYAKGDAVANAQWLALPATTTEAPCTSTAAPCETVEGNETTVAPCDLPSAETDEAPCDGADGNETTVAPCDLPSDEAEAEVEPCVTNSSSTLPCSKDTTEEPCGISDEVETTGEPCGTNSSSTTPCSEETDTQPDDTTLGVETVADSPAGVSYYQSESSRHSTLGTLIDFAVNEYVVVVGTVALFMVAAAFAAAAQKRLYNRHRDHEESLALALVEGEAALAHNF